MRNSLTLILVAALTSCAVAQTQTDIANWNGFTSGTATGDISGIGITATTSNTSPFIGIVNNRWVSGGSGGWNAGLPLNAADLAIVASDVNVGDFQEFMFAQPLDGFLYIENFDSSSIANITAAGATNLSILTGSSSISYNPTAANAGTLTTSNPTFDGEGDAVLAFTGPVTSIRLDYLSGEEANGVFYTFARELPTSVSTPEPSSMALTLIATLGVASLIRKRRRS